MYVISYMKATKEILELAEKEYANSKESIRNIAKKYNIDRFIITGWLLAKGYSVYNRRAERGFNVNFFDSIDSEEKAYWLGFMYADGWINKNNTSWNIGLALKLDDLSHLQKFGKAIEKEHITFSKVACKISLGSKHMFNTLRNYGCVERKSLILQFPKEEIFVSKNLIRHFIRGYFDGDGCVSYTNKNHTSYSVSILGTKQFLEKLKEYTNIKNKIT